jgi:hypothetical protein
MTFKPPRRPPGNRSHLERLVQALSVEEGIAADRLRRWVSAQVLLGALGRDDDDVRRFLLKGGVAMELRLRLRARATRDVDILVLVEEKAGWARRFALAPARRLEVALLRVGCCV